MSGHFPRLDSANHRITSPQTISYNCVAWAANDDSRWWWPSRGFFWPASVERENTLSSFEKAYNTIGYTTCVNGILEQGYQKIAIYADRFREPTHAARQLPDGTWTSKLGREHDIAHDSADTVGGGIYGEVAFYMKRKTS